MFFFNMVLFVLYFFFNDTATTEIYTLSLHDALRSDKAVADTWNNFWKDGKADGIGSNLSRNCSKDRKSGSAGMPRPISYAVFCLKKKKTNLTNLLLENV